MPLICRWIYLQGPHFQQRDPVSVQQPPTLIVQPWVGIFCYSDLESGIFDLVPCGGRLFEYLLDLQALGLRNRV